jgi:hypothetical protein
MLVPGERIELPTNGLQNRCSTAELTRQVGDVDVLDTPITAGLPVRAPKLSLEQGAAEQDSV